MAQSGTILAEGRPPITGQTSTLGVQRFFNRQATPGQTISEVKFYGNQTQ